MKPAPERYNLLVIILHWVMTIAFLLMLISGLIMEEIEFSKSLKFQLYQWHKSLGILLLISFFLRLAVRLFTCNPDMPASMNPFEQKMAKLGHLGLYGLMIALPITGWFMVSSSSYGLPTIVFGWFQWPHIPYMAANEIVNDVAEETHEFLANIFMIFIAVHILAVVKHNIFDKENLLPRMGIGKEKQKK